MIFLVLVISLFCFSESHAMQQVVEEASPYVVLQEGDIVHSSLRRRHVVAEESGVVVPTIPATTTIDTECDEEIKDPDGPMTLPVAEGSYGSCVGIWMWWGIESWLKFLK